MDTSTELLRHYLASLAYHITKVVQDIPAHYPDFELGDGVRTPTEIVNHINDVLIFAYGCYRPHDYDDLRAKKDNMQPWQDSINHFYTILAKLDAVIANGSPQDRSEKQLLQGPLSDVMTHIGQLAMIRRLAGKPVPSEDFSAAKITVGRVGPDQADPAHHDI